LTQTWDSPAAFDRPGGSVAYEALVVAEAAGEAAPEQRALLEADPERWRLTLERLFDETEDSLDVVRQIRGPEREQIVADFEQERQRLGTALARLTGVPVLEPGAPAGGGTTVTTVVAEPPRLQASWKAGQLVTWVGGAGTAPLDLDTVRSTLAEAGAACDWQAHNGVQVPGFGRAPAVVAPAREALGWLVAMAALPGRSELSPSVRWLSTVAAWAVELVARGWMAPQLAQHQLPRDATGATGVERVELGVRWVPAMVEPKRLAALAESLPGPVTALEGNREPRAVTLDVLATLVDLICREGAERLEMPAAPDRPVNAGETAEAFLSRLDGEPFQPPKRIGAELSHRVERWGRPITRPVNVRLIVQLDPPEDNGGWHLSVLADGVDRHPTRLDLALVTAAADKARQVETELARLERLLPALARPGGHRRGEVVLDQNEAWELMSSTGRRLEQAGFDVRVPVLATRKPKPVLRLEADPSTPSVVGAHQLADVRWSVLFGEVELDAADIARLAKEARPMVRSRGQWVALDRADLNAAAEALAERKDTGQLTGAELLRHALGLEGSPLAGGLTLAGSNWAADLLARAEEVKADPMGAPKGFQGELRSYQAEALAWLGFLDGSGLGGCLALDMGLGKTPTLLAHLLVRQGTGPSLVVAPPAVVGNWHAEARRFTPDLHVVVHHGSGRSSAEEIADEVADADVVLTTYGTAVRDIDALADIEWGRVVLDEAQVIKNPASDTAQQLRRLGAHSRVALTGTPIENGLGDLWAILDFTNPGLVGARAPFIANLSADHDAGRDGGEQALRALNGLLVFRRTKAEPAIAAELPDRIDELDHCSMTPEQIGLYQAVLDELVLNVDTAEGPARKGAVLAAITALKQICNHPAAYDRDPESEQGLAGRSGKLSRLEEIVDSVFAAGERVLIFTHFAEWGQRLAEHLTERNGLPVECYHGGLSRGARDRMIETFQNGTGPGALVLSLKAGGTGLNLTAANHVVLYDRWWNPAVEDQARDRAWRIGQKQTVVCHRLVCPGTVDERVEEVVAGKRRVADMVLPKSSSISDLDSSQLRKALGLVTDELVIDEPTPDSASTDGAPDDDASADDDGSRA